jgi:hypothetical protein
LIPFASASPQTWQSSSSNQNFGVVSAIIHRIEDLLSNAQRTLNNNDFFDFQNRLYNLKQAASLEITRGADGSAFTQPLQSLEAEINSKLHDNGQANTSRKTQLELSIVRLESLLKSKSDDLTQEDWSAFLNKLTDLKARCVQNSKIMDKVIFSPHKGSLTFTRDDESIEKARNDSRPQQGSGSVTAPAADSGNTSNTSAKLEKTTAVIRAPKKPPVPIPKLMERIENELIDFHEKHQIGSFDMDSFTERLLAQKRNLHVMMSKTGRISARQEAVIRQELEQLQDDLTERVSGKR